MKGVGWGGGELLTDVFFNKQDFFQVRSESSKHTLFYTAVF